LPMGQVGDHGRLIYVMYDGKAAFKGSPEEALAEAKKHRERASTRRRSTTWRNTTAYWPPARRG
ncbi:MAG: hypothetical protein ACP5KY_09855, partial [Thermoproteus sp.]